MITYTGRISFVRFYSEETKFIVASFECNEEGQNITITGSMSHVSKDETYRLTGDYVVHPRYGKQFKISSYEVVLATDKSEIVRYLSSSLFKGIGRKQAETIVNTLGDDALSKIKEDPSCLLAVKGMSQRKIDVIVNVFDPPSRELYPLDRLFPAECAVDMSDLVKEVDETFDINRKG